jgi:hypothetical protein
MIGIGIGINRRPLGAASYADIISKAYEARVIADGGVVESLECFTEFAIELNANNKPTLTQWQLITKQWQQITTTWN